MYYRNIDLSDLPGEIWKAIAGYEGIYEISTYSRVKSLPRIDCMGQRRDLRILKQSLDTDGYPQTTLSRDRTSITIKPYRVCAIHFIANPLDHPQVNHIDGVKTNGSIENLEWCTSKQNTKHAIETGLRKDNRGEENYGAVLTAEQVIEIYKSPLKQKRISEMYPVNYLAINRIKNGTTWSHVTGHVYSRKKK